MYNVTHCGDWKLLCAISKTWEIYRNILSCRLCKPFVLRRLGNALVLDNLNHLKQSIGWLSDQSGGHNMPQQCNSATGEGEGRCRLCPLQISSIPSESRTKYANSSQPMCCRVPRLVWGLGIKNSRDANIGNQISADLTTCQHGLDVSAKHWQDNVKQRTHF